MQKQTGIDSSWMELLKGEFEKPYMKQLEAFLAQEAASGATIYPPRNEIFQALFTTSFEKVRVVIVGQDPYHGPGQAHGLSFSVRDGVPHPPSLQNIFKELQEDLGVPIPVHGCLERWAKQGVLLLNATLTVRENAARSHYGKGWEQFTDRVIEALCSRKEPMVFLLWGKSAQEKCKEILAVKQALQHLVLTAPHPSPLSAYAGFFGCRHFSKANAFLQKLGQDPIAW